MTEKKSTTMHGVLVYPLQIGACALIFHRGQLIRTSTVVAIHYDAPEVMQFETLNTHYQDIFHCLLNCKTVVVC